MHEKPVREKNNIIIKKTNRIPRTYVGHYGPRNIRDNKIIDSGLHDEAKNEQAVNDRYIKALKQLSSTINEIRTRAYKRIDRIARDLSEEQIYAMIIELTASIERLYFWTMIKRIEDKK